MRDNEKDKKYPTFCEKNSNPAFRFYVYVLLCLN